MSRPRTPVPGASPLASFDVELFSLGVDPDDPDEDIVAYRVIDRADDQCVFSGVEHRSKVREVCVRQAGMLARGTGLGDVVATTREPARGMPQ